MTAATAPVWWAAPDRPQAAAPIRAVDGWHAERTPGGLAVMARVRVDGEDPNLRGHFPELAIYPGVFIVETLCQSMALAVPADPCLRVLRSVRFLAPLLAGDELHLHVTAKEQPGDGWDVTAQGVRARDGVTVARVSAEFGPAPAWLPPVAAEPVRPPVRGHEDVRSVLPQRHPLLLVDRVLDYEPGVAVTAVKTVTGTEPCYAWLPEGAKGRQYDYPASLLIESLGQSAALLWLGGRPADPDALLMFVGARDLCFEGAVRPGDVLLHRVRLDSVVAGTAFATGETWTGGRRVASVTSLIATQRPVRPTDLVPAAGTGPGTTGTPDLPRFKEGSR